jgi:predicted TIM-barrel fold metal-dependent hydrolase
VEEALLLALKYRNVYLDTSIVYSGTPRDALQHVLAEQVGVEVLERSLPHQVLFGSNYPRADIRRSARGLAALPLSPGLREAIARGNAAELLGLKGRP